MVKSRRAVEIELESTSLNMLPISKRRKNGRKESIFMTDGLNYKKIFSTDARSLYHANKDHAKLCQFLAPIEFCQTIDRAKATFVEHTLQIFIKSNIIGGYEDILDGFDWALW